MEQPFKRVNSLFSALVISISIGGFHHQKITGIGRVRVQLDYLIQTPAYISEGPSRQPLVVIGFGKFNFSVQIQQIQPFTGCYKFP